MWRLTKMSGTWYALDLSDVDALENKDVIEDIQSLIESGDMVTLTDDIEYFADEFGVNIDDIVVV